MKKLVVIDHPTKRVVVYPYDENIWDCPEDYTDENGMYVIDSNCSWIVVDELNIKII